MDYDGDGIQDFISGSYDPGDVYLFRGLGKGVYAKVEVLRDEDGTPIVHHPKRLVEYEEFVEAGEQRSDEATQARVASFGSWAAPVDFEDDGDLDLLIGSFGGQLFLRTNVGTRTEPVYSRDVTQIHAGGKPFKVIGHANPVVADWDDDGLWDLVVGASDRSVAWYRNRGSSKAPEFDAGEVLVRAKSDNKFMKQWLLDGQAPRPAVRAQICVTDYDGDGALDLIVGDYSDVARPLEPAAIGDSVALAAQVAKASAARTYAERSELAAPFADRFGEAKRHSAVWLYRRIPNAKPSGIAVDVPIDTPSDDAPVALGAGLDGTPEVGSTFDVVVRLRTAKGWHVYDLDGPEMYADTELELELPDGLEPVGAWRAPDSEPYRDGLRVWSGDVVFAHEVEVTSQPAAGAEIGVTVAYQTCNAAMCYPPTSKALTVALKAGATDDATAWAPHRATRVLYAGAAGGHRETVFAKFLAEHFDVSATIPAKDLSMETAKDYDVVILDWKSQYGLDGYEDDGSASRVPVTLGRDFTKPVIAMTYVGTKARRGQKLDWL